MKTVFVFLMASLMCAVSVRAAEDSPQGRQSAVDRYLRAVPTARMYEEMLASVGAQLPSGQRDAYLAQMKKMFPPEVMERVTRESLSKTFTADEINAMTDFLTSKHGASVFKKMPQFTTETMQATQQEMMRAMLEAQKSRAAK